MKFEVRSHPVRGYQVGFWHHEGIRKRWTRYSVHEQYEIALEKAKWFNQVFPEQLDNQQKLNQPQPGSDQ